MGSMLAYREKVFKKRLAYSTVSQISYILFGLALLSPQAMTGALLHTIFHAIIKSTLFLCAGVFIFDCGKTRVSELTGIGKRMPKLLWCYTFASLALIGIPPASGFISKWYLAQGALEAGAGIWGYIGPAVLLVSALLTAGYLLPVTMKGFLPGKETLCKEYDTVQEPVITMLAPIAILAALTLLAGIFPNLLTKYIIGLVSGLM